MKKYLRRSIAVSIGVFSVVIGCGLKSSLFSSFSQQCAASIKAATHNHPDGTVHVDETLVLSGCAVSDPDVGVAPDTSVSVQLDQTQIAQLLKQQANGGSATPSPGPSASPNPNGGGAANPTPTPAPAAAGPKMVQFVIASNILRSTGMSWNSPATAVQVKVGDTLRVVNLTNEDKVIHTSNGMPFPHQDKANPIKPLTAQDFLIQKPCTVNSVEYDHLGNSSMRFYINAMP